MSVSQWGRAPRLQLLMPRVFPHAAVAADHEIASRAGVEILRAGGNAVDAAVAASFTLSVVRPYSCGIGGGGFMVLHLPADPRRVSPGRVVTAIDYRESGPAWVREDSFESDPDPRASTHGGKAVCVPGTVAGLLYALERYGTMPREKVMAPSIRAAREGFAADAHFVNVAAAETIEWARTLRSIPEQYRFLWERVLKRGEIKIGDRIEVSEQAGALEKIAAHGRDGFYVGEVARAMIDAVHRAGATITAEDLAAYRVRELAPFSCRFRGKTILTMPPPSSGGIVLAQVFGMLEQRAPDLGAAIASGHNSAAYIHLVAEAGKHAFADRARWLGDTAFVDVPLERLLSPEYIAERAKQVDLTRTFEPEHYGTSPPLPGKGGTSHLCVVDPQGGAVSCTETINLYFGSCVAVPEFGFFLNDEMDDFQARLGVANAFALKHATRNRPEPGKRPLSSMTPTIVLEGDDSRTARPIFLAGASGGPRIISGTMQAALNAMLFDRDAEVAVTSPRFHHQWSPDVLQLEPALHASPARASLENLGHRTELKDTIGAVQAIRAADGGGWQAASDPRKGGAPDGY